MRRIMRVPVLTALIALCALGALGALGSLGADEAHAADAARASEDARSMQILGNWLTEKRDGIIQISRTSEGLYQGKIVGGDDPQRTDAHNPDPALRQRSLLGQIILQDMQYDGGGRWSAGTIYDPDSGHTYRCRLELRGADQLHVRGFLGVSLLGRSQTWTRYRGSSMQLPPPSGR
ncbi:MAG TPA: DUF2147 domain-containing protein [Steroidobacteraceae bacterium]|nr:DUF2147 domain-containing protein [Steroidobacteraceae bacterium]